MGINRSKIAKQLLAEGGEVSLKDAKKMAPEGEFLAYINPKEAQMLKDAGGSGIMTPLGIPSFVDFGGSGTGYGSAADTFSAAAGSPGANSRSDFGGDSGPGPGPGPGPVRPESMLPRPIQVIKDIAESKPVRGAQKAMFARSVLSGNPFSIGLAGLQVLGGIRQAGGIRPYYEQQKTALTNFLGQPTTATPPMMPTGGDMAEPIRPRIPMAATTPTDIEQGLSDLELYIQSLRAAQPSPFMLDPRFAAADGGRVGYGLGSLVKKITKPFKKLFKSDVGKAAITAAGLYAGSKIPGLGKFVKKALLKDPESKYFGLEKGLTGVGKLAAIGLPSLVAGLSTKQSQEDDETLDEVLARRRDTSGLRELIASYPEFRFKVPTQYRLADGGLADMVDPSTVDIEKLDREYFERKDRELMRLMEEEGLSLEEALEIVSPGTIPATRLKDEESFRYRDEPYGPFKEKRVMAQDGGIMDLGGNEMDLRGGGFVPIGAKEKADDVPARLSKNEFVFTADAVRGAGEGSVEEGAKKMYKTMKQLESRVE